MKRIVSSALIASFTLASSYAGAAGKFTKKESEIVATQTEATKPTQHKAEDKKRPTITADDVFGGVGEQVKSITDQVINKYKRLIDVTNDNDPEKPDLLFRLAESYNEQYRYYDFRAREIDEKVFNAGNAGNKALEGQLKAQQADYQKKAQQWLLASAKAYLEVADHPDKYGSYKRMDEVLFYLAYMLNTVKKEDAARKYFKRLIKDYPKSKYVPWAFFAFGQYYFDNKNFEDAMKFYDKVLQFPESSVFIYAKYYEGWVYFNLGDFKQSLATFVGVIDLTQKPGTAGAKAGKIALEREAKKDSVRAYARVGTPEKAWDFFRRIGGNYAMTMMEQLGELYNAQGQFQDSIKVYRNMMVLEPTSPKLCFWQGEVMKNTLSATGSRASADNVKELQRLGAVYEKVKEAKGLKKDQLEECRDTTRNTLGELATVWHKEAQKTNNNDTYALAQYLYKEYLTRFPKEKDVYQMTFYYGELLFKLGSNGDNNSYCNAAPIYTKVVELNPAPTAKYLKESAYAAVISWKNCLSVADDSGDTAAARVAKSKEVLAAKASGQKKPKEGEAEDAQLIAEKPISSNQLKMLAAFDTYIKYVPDSAELPNIKYRKARIYYEFNHFKEAIPLFKDIAEHHQTSELAFYSTNLIFDCMSILKKYDELQGALDEYCPMYEEKDATVKSQCAQLKSGLTRKRIEIAQEQGRFKEVAQMYMKEAQEYPNDPKLDEVYYNAAVNFERAKLLGSAIQAREILLKTKPDSVLAKKAIYQIGRNFQDVAAYNQAADYYEQFAEKYPGEKDAPVALESASFYRRGLGDNDKAIKDVSLYVKDYGGRHEFVDKAATADFDQGQIYEQQKDYAKLQKHFLDYLKQWGAKGGVDHQIVAHVKIGEILWKQSCPLPDGGINDACIEVKRERAGGAARVAEKQAKAQKGKKKSRVKHANLPPQCGPETKSKVIVHDRKPGPLKEAMTHFAEALKLFKGGAADKGVPGKDEQERNNRTSTMNFYASEARFRQGDVEYEKFLKLAVPDKLDFSPAPPDASPAKIKAAKKKFDENQKKFLAWYTGKLKQIDVSQKVYQSVIQMKQAHWVIAAAARIGQLYQDFSGQLYTAQVPKAGAAPAGYPQEDFEVMFHDAYCDAMVDRAEPLETKAIDALSVCLNKSTDLSFYDEWSQLCEAELNQLKPVEYPVASEIRAQPGYVGQVLMDRAPVQTLEMR